MTTTHLTTCLNCGAALAGRFCAHCGQKSESINPTLREVLQDLMHEITHVDSKLLQSTRLLLTNPGFLTREIFAGRRARYVSPIRLYLVFSVLYFGVATFAPVPGPRISCTKCPPEQRAAREREMQEAVTHWAPRTMFVLVPAFAGLVALVVGRRTRNYPQHLYFALHVHAAWFFAGVIVGLLGLVRMRLVASIAAATMGAYAIVYLGVAFRRAYGATLVRSIVGTAVVVVTYLFAVILTVLAIILPVVLFSRTPH